MTLSTLSLFSLGVMGVWFGVMCNVLYLVDHVFNAIFMPNGLVFQWFMWGGLYFILLNLA